MKYSCDLIRDLLPLYCDQVCSEDSAEAVKEHISACEECKNIYTKMQQGVSLDSAKYEMQQLASVQEVKKKIKTRNIIFAAIGIAAGVFLIGIVISIMLVSGVIRVAIQKGWEDCYTSTDINDYGVFEAFNGYSKLDVFPEQIRDGMEVYQYSYFYADTFLDPSAQIYLECGYAEEDYGKEIERLAGIQEEYNGRIQKIVYDTESFSYPAYVAINADNHCYEYALLIGDNRIAYVFLQFIQEGYMVFPVDYLPKEYEQQEKGAGYSIYLFDSPSGDRYGVF